QTAVIRHGESLLAVDALSGAHKGKYVIPKGNPTMPVLSPNGKTVALIAQNDTMVRLLDVPSFQERAVLQSAQPFQYNTANFSGDGQLLVAVDGKSNIHVWDLTSGKEQRHAIPPQ